MNRYVDELYDKMSQEERIAQLRSGYMDDLFDEDGQLDTARCRELIPFGIGHFSQYASQKPMDPNVLRDRVAAVQDWLMTWSLSRNLHVFLPLYLLTASRRPVRLAPASPRRSSSG